MKLIEQIKRTQRLVNSGVRNASEVAQQLGVSYPHAHRLLSRTCIKVWVTHDEYKQLNK